MLRVGFVGCIGLYVLAGDFCMGSLQRLSPPAFLWRRSDFPAPGKQREQDSVCARLCVLQCVSALLCVHTRATRARQTFPISVLRFEKRGRKSQSSSYYSSLKANGEEAEEEEGGRDGCREEERESQTGGMKGGGGGDTLTLISLYSAFCIPGCALSLSPSLLLSLPFLHSLPSVPRLHASPNISHSARRDVCLCLGVCRLVCGLYCIP